MAVNNKIFIPTFISSINYEPVRTLPHIYFYNGLKSSEEYFIQHYPSGSTSSVSVNLETSFPYFDYYDGLTPNSASNSLLFFNETPPYGSTPTASLYTEYWETYVSLLYNPRTRLFNASAIIPLADYFDMELNDIVQWRGNYYHLRAINDYNLKDGTCKIQLLGPIIRDAYPKPIPTPPVDSCFFDFTSVPITTTTTTTTAAPTTTTTTAAGISGNKMLILNVWNKTTESIDWTNVNFNFQDAPNIRVLNTTSGFSPPVYYYISGSELPVGKSTNTSLMNITASFTSSALIYDIEPDVNSTIQRYTISSSFFTDGTPRTGGSTSSPTSRVNSQISADYNFNPTTWTTMSLDITASYTASAEKFFIIESQNNSTYYAGTASSDDIFLNQSELTEFKKDTYPIGLSSSSATRNITGSNTLNTFIGWPFGSPYMLNVTQSLFGDNVLLVSTSGTRNLSTSGGSLLTTTINYDAYQVIKSVTIINDAP